MAYCELIWIDIAQNRIVCPTLHRVSACNTLLFMSTWPWCGLPLMSWLDNGRSPLASSPFSNPVEAHCHNFQGADHTRDACLHDLIQYHAPTRGTDVFSRSKERLAICGHSHSASAENSAIVCLATELSQSQVRAPGTVFQYMFALLNQCTLLENVLKRFYFSVRILNLIRVLTLLGVLVAYVAYVALNLSFLHYVTLQDVKISTQEYTLLSSRWKDVSSAKTFVL